MSEITTTSSESCTVEKQPHRTKFFATAALTAGLLVAAASSASAQESRRVLIDSSERADDTEELSCPVSQLDIATKDAQMRQEIRNAVCAFAREYPSLSPTIEIRVTTKQTTPSKYLSTSTLSPELRTKFLEMLGDKLLTITRARVHMAVHGHRASKDIEHIHGSLTTLGDTLEKSLPCIAVPLVDQANTDLRQRIEYSRGYQAGQQSR